MGRIFKKGLGSLGWARGFALLAFSLRIRSVCSSPVEINHTFMEMSLNLICFTDLYFIESLTSLFSLFSTHIFSPSPLILRCLGYKILMNFQGFFFVANCIVLEILMSSILLPSKIQAHHKKYLNEHVTYKFILMDSIIICIHFRSI